MNVVRENIKEFLFKKGNKFFKSCYWIHYTITVVTERERDMPLFEQTWMHWPDPRMFKAKLGWNLLIACFRATFSVLKGIFSYLHFKIDEALHWKSSSLYLKMIYANDLCLVEISFVFLLKNLFSKVTKVLSVFIYLFVIIFPGREFGWNWFSDFRVEY